MMRNDKTDREAGNKTAPNADADTRGRYRRKAK
jgi:hypothetical protein